MRGISVNDDGSHEDHGDILSREMKSRTHSVKVSLLIVQVPVQTERLNPRGTNPARKSLSLYVPFCPVPSRVSCIRIRILLPSTRVSVSTSTHGRSYSVTATRSHIRTQDRKPLPPSYIHRGLCSAPSRPSILFPSRHTPALSFSLSRTRKETHNKNNKKCFLPFRLNISHLALSSFSQSYIQSFSWSSSPIGPFFFLFYIIFKYYTFSVISINFFPSFKWFLENSSTIFNLNLIKITIFINFYHIFAASYIQNLKLITKKYSCSLFCFS